MILSKKEMTIQTNRMKQGIRIRVQQKTMMDILRECNTAETIHIRGISEVG